MIQARLEKEQMECTEGTNHLWIHFDAACPTGAEEPRLRLVLPQGLHALKNLNGFPEDQPGTIHIPNSHDRIDLIIELFTEEAIPCRKSLFVIVFSYRLDDHYYEEKKRLCLSTVPEDMIGGIQIDLEVAAHVKALKKYSDPETEADTFLFIPAIAQPSENKLSPLEKKYRMDGCHEAFR